MAGLQNTSSIGTRRFDKSLNEDVNDFHLPENCWTQARNAINNSKTGDLGKLGNEPSNLYCNSAPYDIIGVVHIVADYWAIYSTNEIDSEIGIFRESTCEYTLAVNDPCLNFSKYNLIKGVSRARSTCNYTLYWADKRRNPDRAMTITIDPVTDNEYTNPNSPIPWNQDCVIVDSCNICTNLPTLNCDKIRLASLIQLPCVETRKGFGAGTLLNGSYQVAVAYAIDNQKISDWYISDIQPLFDHDNAASSLDVILSNVDQDFDQIQVALISTTNQQTVVRLAGTYSTRQQQLSFDTIDNAWPVIPIEQIPIMTPIVESSDSMGTVNDYLIRIGPSSREDFNYQPLANQIVTKWQSVEYPSDYYRRGGNKTNYLRDEIYPFFIRWIYDTGDKSAAYHIPGRPAGAFWTNPSTGSPFPESDFLIVSNTDASPELAVGLTPYNWVVYNTGLNIPIAPVTLPDGGTVIGEGLMGYWESTEIYPDNQPEIWNSNILVSPYNAWDPGVLGTAHDLCGKPIRHHRFPDLSLSQQTEYTSTNGAFIRVMGIKFENIKLPLLNDGVTPVPGIVGYEILRGARNGNKTILAKGLINNMRLYDLPNGTANSRQGAFPNYPYNEIGRPDPFLSTTEVISEVCGPFGGSATPEADYNPQTAYSQTLFTFHSPDTNFTNPFLSAKELKIHGEFNGDIIGKFEISEEHPKEKLLTNFAFILSSVAGLGIAAMAMNGQRRITYNSPQTPGYSFAGPSGTSPNPISAGIATAVTIPLLLANQATYNNLSYSPTAVLLASLSGVGTDSAYTALQTGYNAVSLSPYFASGFFDIERPDTDFNSIPTPLRILSNIPLFLNYFTQGTDTTLEFLRAIVRYRDFALRYHSHGLYNRYQKPVLGNMRRVINESQYIGSQITDFGLTARINNLYRGKTVALETALPFLNPLVNDVTRIQVTAVNDLLEPQLFPINMTMVPKNPAEAPFGTGANFNIGPGPANNTITPGNAGFFYGGHSGIQIASSHYSSLKQRIRNQYGQINGVMQVPASTCVQKPPVDINTPAISETIFGGDTYVGRYTEKNTFFYFYDWLYGQPDGAQFDYTKAQMIPYPRFWANFEQFEIGDFMASLSTIFTFPPTFAGVVLPNDYRNLDGLYCPPSWLSFDAFRLSTRSAWFYLFNSGVRDFYVESEINIDLRDWGELETEQHYDPYRYSDTKALFDTRIIKSGNYYKYDQSLSISKLWNNYISWAAVQPITYNPTLAATCFIYSPKRVIYSLQAQYEGIRDNWKIFLANNYKDFLSKVTSIKPISKSGAMLFFENESPVMFQGVDQLQTTSGTKLTIGDGGLFSQPMQNMVNVDRPYEYGSCQDSYSVINTPAGVFWMSQNQGKVFNYAGSLAEISMQDLKWWFAAYLPYKIQDQFPNFELTDNPVAGIGCQTIYDNENGLIYFTKRDFSVRTDLPVGTTLKYVGLDNFEVYVNSIFQFRIKLGDPSYFEDASWTVSYDPKAKAWLSYHDWHPNLMIPGKNTFMTTKGADIWIHNKRCDSYCNYYGIDYPFEIEWLVNTVQTVNTLRSVEYQMEAYRYADNCYDRFHDLTFNFDQAVVYNTEQCSGELRLNLFPQNDPQAVLNYPQINFNTIDILYSKEEQKYRFDQFWDITDDRGEFNPAAQRMIWNTAANGYVRTLNPNNLNYIKDQFERKKFRHYMNLVLLRKRVSGNRKILVSIANDKNLYSPR